MGKISLIYRKAITVFFVIVAIISAKGQNPYLPLWEHIPDSEPYVFEDPDRPGKYRVYVYGSHDDLVTDYCGLNQIVWSAPVDDLTQWRYDGVCFASAEDNNGKELFVAKVDANGKRMNAEGCGDLLYAPDVVEVMENGKKVYYFTPN
ncbi:MAG: glycosyl hydrolase family 43, partial [Bacteroidales bacterium]|nr:glycosyl hydrolase family 43 [Bacteroidales bacterium]